MSESTEIVTSAVRAQGQYNTEKDVSTTGIHVLRRRSIPAPLSRNDSGVVLDLGDTEPEADGARHEESDGARHGEADGMKSEGTCSGSSSVVARDQKVDCVEQGRSVGHINMDGLAGVNSGRGRGGGPNTQDCEELTDNPADEHLSADGKPVPETVSADKNPVPETLSADESSKPVPEILSADEKAIPETLSADGTPGTDNLSVDEVDGKAGRFVIPVVAEVKELRVFTTRSVDADEAERSAESWLAGHSAAEDNVQDFKAEVIQRSTTTHQVWHEPCPGRLMADDVEVDAARPHTRPEENKPGSIASTSSASLHESVSSLDSEFEIEKRKRTMITVNGQSSLFKMVSVKYHYGQRDRRKRHFVQQSRGNFDVTGRKGLKHNDELLAVNGRRLVNKGQKKVRKIFRRIKPSGKGGEIHLDLELRRWKTDRAHQHEVLEVALQLKLTPVPLADSQTAVVFRASYREELSNPELLPPGGVSGIEYQDTGDKLIKLSNAIGGIYLLPGSNNCLTGEPMSQDETDYTCTMMEFEAQDKVSNPLSAMVFLVILSYNKDGQKLSLISDVSPDSALHFRQDQTEPNRTTADERFFIVRQIGSMYALEACLRRGHYVFYDSQTRMCKMGKPDRSDIVGEHVEKLDGYLFDLLPCKNRQMPNRTWADALSFLFACGGRNKPSRRRSLPRR